MLFELERERAHEHNPRIYIELLGTALHTLMVHEYAPAAERYRHLIGRLQKIPAFLDQARANLKASSTVWIDVAIDENQGVNQPCSKGHSRGTAGRVEGRLRCCSRAGAGRFTRIRRLPEERFAEAAAGNDWRLGSQLYSEKLKVMLNTDKTRPNTCKRPRQRSRRPMTR